MSSLSGVSESPVSSAGAAVQIYSLVDETFINSDLITFIQRKNMTVSETATTVDTVESIAAKVIAESIIINGTLESNVTLYSIISEIIENSDQILIAFYGNVSDSLAVNDTLSGIVQKLNIIIESINVLDIIQDNATLINIILDSVIFSDEVKHHFEKIINESFSTLDTITVLSKLKESLAEVITASDVATGTARIYILTTDSSTFNDTLSNTGSFNALIEENIIFEIVYVGDDITYSGWVMNPEVFAVSTYSNYNFNSFAKHSNGKYLGANENGIYELDGTTDAGTYIESTIVTAAMDFGTSNLKQVTDLYIGYTSDGNIILKVRKDGDVEVHYELSTYFNGLSTNRIKIGKGLVGRYWQFELVTKDNSSLNIDSIEFHPVLFGRKH